MTEQQMTVRKKVIDYIIQRNQVRFRAIDNTGQDKKVVAGQFPDIIFLQREPPPNNNILFVLKVETGENLVDSVPGWRDLGSAPSVLYVVVPREKLDEAKKLAGATSVRARFAWYELVGEAVKQVIYE